jgi:hypothetical protein
MTASFRPPSHQRRSLRQLYFDFSIVTLGCLAVTLLSTSMCHILVFSTAEMTALSEFFLLLFVSFTTGTWV